MLITFFKCLTNSISGQNWANEKFPTKVRFVSFPDSASIKNIIKTSNGGWFRKTESSVIVPYFFSYNALFFLSKIEKQFLGVNLRDHHLICAQNFPKNEHFLPTCAHLEVRNICFSEKFTYVLNEWSFTYLTMRCSHKQNFDFATRSVNSNELKYIFSWRY